MAIDQSFAQVVNLLKEATDAGRLNWEKTADPAEFKARLPGGYVRLIRENTTPAVGGPRPALVLILLDSNGQIIEDWQPVDEREWDALEELARAARRRALHIEEKLKSVIEDLQMIIGKG